MKKKLICILISGFMIMSYFISVYATDSEPADFLVKVAGDGLKIDEEKNVTREEFVTLILKLLYGEVDFSDTIDGQQIFRDVEKNNPYYFHIKAAKQLGIIRGDLFNNFYPDRQITVTEAVVMLLNAYGYARYANAKGGYPSGYIAVANEIELTKNIQFSDTVTGEIASRMLYNSLFADVVLLDTIGSEYLKSEIINGVDMLSQRFRTEKYTALVVDNGFTSLEGNSICLDDQVVIKVLNNDEYIQVYVTEPGIQNCLGSKVNVYIRYDEINDRNEIIHYTLHKSSKEVMIYSDQIIDVTDGYIEYEPSPNYFKYVKMSLEQPAPIVIYNGSIMNTYNNDIFKAKDGIVRFVDSDGNGKYELLEITSFNFRGEIDTFGYINQDQPAWNIVVDQVNLEHYFISCKLNPRQNNLDIDKENSIIRFIQNDNIESFADIEPDDIISVALSPQKINGKKLYLLAVSKKKVTSPIYSYTESSIVLKDGEYKISSALINNFKIMIQYEMPIEFYLDSMNKISYIPKLSSVSKNYGYLIGMEIEDSLLDQLHLKIFTKNGKIEYLYGANKMMIDGISYTGSMLQYEKIALRNTAAKKLFGDSEIARPIIYETNRDGFVTKIDTDNPNDMDGDSDNIYADYSPLKYSNEEINDRNTLKAGLRYFRNVRYKPDTKTFDGRFFISNDTMIISVPDIDTYGLGEASRYLSDSVESIYESSTIETKFVKQYEKEISDSNYKILNMSDLQYAYIYDAQGYDIDPDTGIASLLVVRGATDIYAYGAYYTNANVYVYLRMTDVYDSSEEKLMHKLYYTKDGVTEEFAVFDDTLLQLFQNIIFGTDCDIYGRAVKPLKAGDLIRVEKNANKLIHFNRILRYEDIDTARSNLGFPHIPRAMYSNDITYINTSPFDMNEFDISANSSRLCRLLKPRNINQNILSAYLGHNKLSDIDKNDPSTFTILFYDLTNVPIVNVMIDKNGTIKAVPGGINNICVDTSIIFMIENNGKIEQFIIYNDERRM